MPICEKCKMEANEKLIYCQIHKDEKDEIFELVNDLQNEHRTIANKYNYIFYTWSFILNAGGMVAAISILNLGDFLLSEALIILFYLGIACIIFALILEIDRFNKLEEQVRFAYKLYKENKNTEAFYEIVNKDNYPSHLTTFFEYSSLVFFTIGLVIGIFLF